MSTKQSEKEIKNGRYEAILTDLINKFILLETDKNIFITTLKLDINKPKTMVKIHCSVWPQDKLISAEHFLNKRIGVCRKYIKLNSHLKIIPMLKFETHLLKSI